MINKLGSTSDTTKNKISERKKIHSKKLPNMHHKESERYKAGDSNRYVR